MARTPGPLHPACRRKAGSCACQDKAVRRFADAKIGQGRRRFTTGRH